MFIMNGKINFLKVIFTKTKNPLSILLFRLGIKKQIIIKTKWNIDDNNIYFNLCNTKKILPINIGVMKYYLML